MCLRPGATVPGAKTISNEGYCGGKNPEDGICPKIFSYIKSEDLLANPNLKNLTVEKYNSTTVHINEKHERQESENKTEILTIIESGRIR
jgi:hypothetical protein